MKGGTGKRSFAGAIVLWAVLDRTRRSSTRMTSSSTTFAEALEKAAG